MTDFFKDINARFDKLYFKRAFVYLYQDMEEGEITESREYVAALERDYSDL